MKIKLKNTKINLMGGGGLFDLTNLPCLFHRCIVYTIVLFLSVFYVSCNYEGELRGKDYYQVSIKVIYPQQSSYKVTYNGESIENKMFSEEEGKLAVYSKETGDLLLDTTVSIKNTIQLIQLPNAKPEIYNKDNYLTFNAVMLSTGYSITLNGQQINSGLNYIHKADANGKWTYYKDGNATFVTSADVVDGKSYLFMENIVAQVDASMNTPNNVIKLAFYYAPQKGIDFDAIELVFTAYDTDLVIIIPYDGSLILEKGKLSDFKDFDISIFKDISNQQAHFYYDIYEYDINEHKRGKLIHDGSDAATVLYVADETTGDMYQTKYKLGIYAVNGSDKFFVPDLNYSHVR